MLTEGLHVVVDSGKVARVLKALSFIGISQLLFALLAMDMDLVTAVLKVASCLVLLGFMLAAVELDN